MRRIESDHSKEDPVDEATADADLHNAIWCASRISAEFYGSALHAISTLGEGLG